MNKPPRFPYQDGLFPNQCAGSFGLRLLVPFKAFVSILEDEFKLKFEGETRRDYEVVVYHDRGPDTYMHNEYVVLSFQSTISDKRIEFAYETFRKPSSLVVLNNDPDLIGEVLARFEIGDLTFSYELSSLGNASSNLKDISENLKLNSFGYEWSLERNSSAEEILFGRSQKIPEFISLNMGENLYVSFLFPMREGQLPASKSYADFCSASYKSEHSVLSVREEAFRKIDSLFAEVLRLSPIMTDFHEYLVRLGFKLKVGRTTKSWFF